MYLGQDFLADLWLALERNSNLKVVQSSPRLSGHVRISIANYLGPNLVCGKSQIWIYFQRRKMPTLPLFEFHYLILGYAIIESIIFVSVGRKNDSL